MIRILSGLHRQHVHLVSLEGRSFCFVIIRLSSYQSTIGSGRLRNSVGLESSVQRPKDPTEVGFWLVPLR